MTEQAKVTRAETTTTMGEGFTGGVNSSTAAVRRAPGGVEGSDEWGSEGGDGGAIGLYGLELEAGKLFGRLLALSAEKEAVALRVVGPTNRTAREREVVGGGGSAALDDGVFKAERGVAAARPEDCGLVTH